MQENKSQEPKHTTVKQDGQNYVDHRILLSSFQHICISQIYISPGLVCTKLKTYSEIKRNVITFKQKCCKTVAGHSRVGAVVLRAKGIIEHHPNLISVNKSMGVMVVGQLFLLLLRRRATKSPVSFITSLPCFSDFCMLI